MVLTVAPAFALPLQAALSPARSPGQSRCSSLAALASASRTGEPPTTHAPPTTIHYPPPTHHPPSTSHPPRATHQSSTTRHPPTTNHHQSQPNTTPPTTNNRQPPPPTSKPPNLRPHTTIQPPNQKQINPPLTINRHAPCTDSFTKNGYVAWPTCPHAPHTHLRRAKNPTQGPLGAGPGRHGRCVCPPRCPTNDVTGAAGDATSRSCHRSKPQHRACSGPFPPSPSPRHHRHHHAIIMPQPDTNTNTNTTNKQNQTTDKNKTDKRQAPHPSYPSTSPSASARLPHAGVSMRTAHTGRILVVPRAIF